MPLQNFVDYLPPTVKAAWLNGVDALKFTIFGDATTKAAARTALELDGQVESFGIDSGAANAAVVTLSGPVTGYVRAVGSKVTFTPIATNNGATTLNVNGTGAAGVVNQLGNALTGGEFSQPVTVAWTGAAWKIIAGSIPVTFARTATETTNVPPVTPTDYRYPEGHGRRYGMLGNNVADDSAACQTWLRYCYGNGVAAVIDGGDFLIANVTVNITGGRTNGGLKITGSGKNVTRFRPFGAPTNLMLIQGATPGAGQPNSVQLMMRDMSFFSTTQLYVGLRLDSIASFHLENISIDACNIGLNLQSALIGSAVRCVFSACSTNIMIRRNGTNAYCNNLSFRDCIIGSALKYGVDMGHANGVKFDNCDIEGNGSGTSPTSTVTISNGSPGVVTWNAHGLAEDDPVIFTTTGTLPSPLVPNQIYYVVSPVTNSFRVSSTVTGGDINTTTAGSGTHTALSPNRGGIVIRETVIQEIGYSFITIDDCWFESNNGAAIRGEYMTSAFGLTLEVRSGHVADTGNSMPFAIGNARFVSISDFNAVVGSNNANISCDGLYLKNSKFINLIRPSVTYTTVVNSTYNGIDFPWGETGSATLSLTGCTTVPTGTMTYNIQGRDITINLPDILGTSNSTAATLTGLPAQLNPSVNRGVPAVMEDNGVDSLRAALVNTSGVITLNYILAFTAAGSKGVRISSFNYQK